jgi:hypothetical protein
LVVTTAVTTATAASRRYGLTGRDTQATPAGIA